MDAKEEVPTDNNNKAMLSDSATVQIKKIFGLLKLVKSII